MKKIYLTLAAVTAMLFTACTQSEDITQNNTNDASAPQAVQFGTYLGKVMRAGTVGAIANGTDLKSKGGFGVFAYYTDATNWANDQTSTAANFMCNQLVSSTDGTTWTYSPVKYWPNDYATGNVDSKTPSSEDQEATGSKVGKISFFAYAPYVETPTDDGYGITAITGPTETGSPKVTYKLAADGSGDFVDLLWGVKEDATPLRYNVNLTKQNTTEKVNFIFKHALAKMGGVGKIKAVLDVDNNTMGALKDAYTNVTIKSITIKNVAGAWATQGVFDLAAGTWAATLNNSSTLGGNVDVTIGSSDIDPNLYSDGGNGVMYSSEWTIPGLDNTKKDVYKSTATAKPFYFIPTIANQKIRVEIKYTVKTYDAKLDGDYRVDTSTITNVVNIGALQPNKYYTLLIHIGLTSVKFSATVDGWDEPGAGEEEEVWLPSNVVS